ncbi:MAG TPA: hypothetical protein VNX01_01375 [Bacteroidia bacterium]|nr:hypothetical protein [Bacteroidia bacterium]
MKTVRMLFLFGIMLLNTTCKQKLFKYVTWDGYAVDQLSGQPAVGKTVTLMACGGGSGDYQPYGCPGNLIYIGSCTTDVSGHFHIHGQAANNPYYYPQYGQLSPEDGVSESDLSTKYNKIAIR